MRTGFDGGPIKRRTRFDDIYLDPIDLVKLEINLDPYKAKFYYEIVTLRLWNFLSWKEIGEKTGYSRGYMSDCFRDALHIMGKIDEKGQVIGVQTR